MSKSSAWNKLKVGNNSEVCWEHTEKSKEANTGLPYNQVHIAHNCHHCHHCTGSNVLFFQAGVLFCTEDVYFGIFLLRIYALFGVLLQG